MRYFGSSVLLIHSQTISNMAFHFEQMMDSKAQFEAEKAKERKLEREALAKAEKQKMEKEQEAIFDAVLQEIFP